MQIIRFIKWWWSRLDEFERSLLFMAPCVLTSLVLAFLAVDVLLLVLPILTGFLLIMLYWISVWLRNYIVDLYKTFKEECPTDDEKLVNRLKGTGPGSYESGK
jgi:phosphoglycerol transferase MdoB-like AlkP superfamily enzyme